MAEHWIGCAHAMRVLGADRKTVHKLAEQGLFTVRRLGPDGPPRYLLADVEAFARDSTTPSAKPREPQPV